VTKSLVYDCETALPQLVYLGNGYTRFVQWRFSKINSGSLGFESHLKHTRDHGCQQIGKDTASVPSQRKVGETVTHTTVLMHTTETTILFHLQTTPRCLPQPARRQICLSLPLLLPANLNHTSDTHRKAVPTSSPGPSRRQNRPLRRLHHPLSASMHDPRQLLARSHQVFRNGRPTTPQPRTDRHDS